MSLNPELTCAAMVPPFCNRILLATVKQCFRSTITGASALNKQCGTGCAARPVWKPVAALWHTTHFKAP